MTMAQRLWTWIAAWIVRRPRVVDWIERTARRHPYLHIHGRDGTLYMERWWLLRGRPAMEACPWWLRWCPIAIRLHHIARPDLDRHVHDHPFDFRTLILSGGYMEQDACGAVRNLVKGHTYHSRAERFHRILVVKPETLTLFIVGPRRQSWGFMVGDRKVHWLEYLSGDGTAYADPYPSSRKD